MRTLLKNKTSFYGIAIAVFLTVSVFSSTMMPGMSHDEMGGIGNCPFQIGGTILCEMNVLDHLALWKAMFASLSPQITIAALLLSALLARAIFRHLFASLDTHGRQPLFAYLHDTHIPSFHLLPFGSAISPRAP